MDKLLYVVHQLDAFAGGNDGQKETVSANDVRRRWRRKKWAITSGLQVEELSKVCFENVDALKADELENLRQVVQLLQPLKQHVILRAQPLQLVRNSGRQRLLAASFGHLVAVTQVGVEVLLCQNLDS